MTQKHNPVIKIVKGLYDNFHPPKMRVKDVWFWSWAAATVMSAVLMAVLADTQEGSFWLGLVMFTGGGWIYRAGMLSRKLGYILIFPLSWMTRDEAPLYYRIYLIGQHISGIFLLSSGMICMLMFPPF